MQLSLLSPLLLNLDIDTENHKATIQAIAPHTPAAITQLLPDTLAATPAAITQPPPDTPAAILPPDTLAAITQLTPDLQLPQEPQPQLPPQPELQPPLELQLLPDIGTQLRLPPLTITQQVTTKITKFLGD